MVKPKVAYMLPTFAYIKIAVFAAKVALSWCQSIVFMVSKRSFHDVKA